MEITLRFLPIVALLICTSCSGTRTVGHPNKNLVSKIPDQQLPSTSINSNLKDVVTQLSQQVYETMVQQNKKKVAVFPLSSPQGKSCELGSYIADKLSNSLFSRADKFEVVERLHIERVLGELKKSETGAIEKSSAKEVGHFLGADVVIVGNFVVLSSTVDVTLRALDTEKMNVLAVADAQIVKSNEIEPLLRGCTSEATPQEPRPVQSTKSFTNSNVFAISYYGSNESFVGESFDLPYDQNHQDFRIEAKTLPSEHVGESFWQLDDSPKQKIERFRFRIPNGRDGGHMLKVEISYLDFNNLLVRKEVKEIRLFMATSRLK